MKMLLALLLSLVTTAAVAQSTAGTMRIIVPFGPGGVQDILARTVSSELGIQLGRNVIVENRPGAGNTIATAAVAKAAPDGNTLILAGSNHFISGALYSKLSYDPLKDFTGVAHIGTVDSMLMINADVPAKSVSEFISYAKANPGKLNYSSAGSGSVAHLSFAYFANLAGIDIVHVPYKSAGEALQEMIAGRVQAVSPATISALPFVKDPRVRVLGMTGVKRSKFLPDVPTIAEAGVPGYEFDSWMGLIGPAGIPRATVDQIDAAMGVLLKDSAILERLAKQGVEPRALSPEAFNAILRADAVKMERVVKISGARVD